MVEALARPVAAVTGSAPERGPRVCPDGALPAKVSSLPARRFPGTAGAGRLSSVGRAIHS